MKSTLTFGLLWYAMNCVRFGVTIYLEPLWFSMVILVIFFLSIYILREIYIFMETTHMWEQ